MKLHAMMLAVAAVVAGMGAETVAPADELARGRADKNAAVPEAPEGYRRPKDWKPVLYPKDLRRIAKEHSAETRRAGWRRWMP